MRSALYDPSLFDNKYLIGPANRREPVGDNESRAVLHEGSQPALDKCFRFRVERARSLIENE